MYLINKNISLFIFLILIFINFNYLLANCTKGNCDNGFGTWEGEDYKYIGQFENGYFSGQGNTIYDSGDSHIGRYKNDLFNGRGVYTFAGGDTYNGDFKDDLRDGFGIYQFSSGSVYEGDWKEDQYHGFGKYTFPNGEYFEGEYKNNKRNGFGILYLASGNIYEGQFQDDNYNGYGVFTFVNGDFYEGEFKNGQYSGYGKFTSSDGTVTEGLFANNQFVGSDNLNSNNDNTNFIEEFFNIEISQNTIKEFFENSELEYDIFEFIDDNSFTIKNISYDDGISVFEIGEITILNLDYYAINKIKLNNELNINLFDKFIIKNYTVKENEIDHFINHFEISNLNINNSSLIYDFLYSLDLIDFNNIDNLKNIFYVFDTISFDKIKINGAKINEIDYYGEWNKLEFNGFDNMKFDKILVTDFYFNEIDYEQAGEMFSIENLEFNRPQYMSVFDINDPDFVLSIFKSLDKFSTKNFRHNDKFENITLNAEFYEISNYKTIQMGDLLFPISLDLSFKNSYFSDFDSEANMYLNLLGYDNVIFDFDIKSSIDYKENEFNLNFKTFVHDALKIDSNLKFSNLDLNSLNLNNDIELIQYFSNEFKFDSFDIKLTDEGLTDRIFVFLEEMYGLNKDEIIEFMLQEVNNDINLQNSIDREYIDKIINFIDKPSNLMLSVNPFEPISYNDLLLYSINPVDLIDILNINLD